MSAFDDYAEALFSTTFQPSDDIGADTVRAAVAFRMATMAATEVAAMVAQEFGDHPQAARDRMRWAIGAVQAAYEPAGVR